MISRLDQRASPVVLGILSWASAIVAWAYRHFHSSTEQVEIVPGLRTTGYRRAVSISFAVDGERVLIFGIFYAGRNIAPGLIEGSL
jgi:toxin ParE1/3/4